jgi:hypothetical protein
LPDLNSGRKMPKQAWLLLSDQRGRVFEYPFFRSVGKSGPYFVPVDKWIPLPEGSKLFTLPGRRAVGQGDDSQELQPVTEIAQERKKLTPLPVGAFLPPGYVRTHLPAVELLGRATILPTWAYTSVAWQDGELVMPTENGSRTSTTTEISCRESPSSPVSFHRTAF